MLIFKTILVISEPYCAEVGGILFKKYFKFKILSKKVFEIFVPTKMYL